VTAGGAAVLAAVVALARATRPDRVRALDAPETTEATLVA
jgi:hypothetical protein